MNLGGRAALSVPLIALIASAFLGWYEMVTQPSNAMIKGWSAFRLVFFYALIVSLPVGAFLAVPTLVLGHLLPKPRWISLGLIGLAVGLSLALLLAGGISAAAGREVFGLAALGVLCAALWWALVERHRERTEDKRWGQRS